MGAGSVHRRENWQVSPRIRGVQPRQEADMFQLWTEGGHRGLLCRVMQEDLPLSLPAGRQVSAGGGALCVLLSPAQRSRRHFDIPADHQCCVGRCHGSSHHQAGRHSGPGHGAFVLYRPAEGRGGAHLLARVGHHVAAERGVRRRIAVFAPSSPDPQEDRPFEAARRYTRPEAHGVRHCVQPTDVQGASRQEAPEPFTAPTAARFDDSQLSRLHAVRSRRHSLLGPEAPNCRPADRAAGGAGAGRWTRDRAGRDPGRS
mmetsp:Transcript_12210/g.37235  ORF Transcript_12210/g.37235 Transcript_12210/m.37235 type:complete len:258 (+) Transcript_12210:887-1660(+)